MIKPITTRINLFCAVCPCCKARVTAEAPADMPEGSPFGPGIKAAVAYLHGCQMVGFKRLTELCEGLFGLTISQRDLQHAGTYPVTAIRLPSELTERIDEWAKACDAQSRSDATRQLIELGLDRSAVKTRQPQKPRQRRSS